MSKHKNFKSTTKRKSHEKYAIVKRRSLEIMKHRPTTDASFMESNLEFLGIKIRNSEEFNPKKKNVWVTTRSPIQSYPKIINLDCGEASDPEIICIDDDSLRNRSSSHHPETINLDDEITISPQVVRNGGKKSKKSDRSSEVFTIDDNDIQIDINTGSKKQLSGRVKCPKNSSLSGKKKLLAENAVCTSVNSAFPLATPAIALEQLPNVSLISGSAATIADSSKSVVSSPSFTSTLSNSQATPAKPATSHLPVSTLSSESVSLKSTLDSISTKCFSTPSVRKADHAPAVSSSSELVSQKLSQVENVAFKESHSPLSSSVTNLSQSNFTPYKRAFELPDETLIKRLKSTEIVSIPTLKPPLSPVSNFTRNGTSCPPKPRFSKEESKSVAVEITQQTKNVTKAYYALRSRGPPSTTLNSKNLPENGAKKGLKNQKPIGADSKSPSLVTESNDNQAFNHRNVETESELNSFVPQHSTNNLNRDSIQTHFETQRRSEKNCHSLDICEPNIINLSGSSSKLEKSFCKNIQICKDLNLSRENEKLNIRKTTSISELDFIPIPSMSKQQENELAQVYRNNIKKRSLCKKFDESDHLGNKSNKKQKQSYKKSSGKDMENPPAQLIHTKKKKGKGKKKYKNEKVANEKSVELKPKPNNAKNKQKQTNKISPKKETGKASAQVNHNEKKESMNKKLTKQEKRKQNKAMRKQNRKLKKKQKKSKKNSNSHAPEELTLEQAQRQLKRNCETYRRHEQEIGQFMRKLAAENKHVDWRYPTGKLKAMKLKCGWLERIIGKLEKRIENIKNQTSSPASPMKHSSKGFNVHDDLRRGKIIGKQKKIIRNIENQTSSPVPPINNYSKRFNVQANDLKISCNSNPLDKRFVDLEENQPRPGDSCCDITWLTVDECHSDLEEPSCSKAIEVRNQLSKPCYEFRLPGRDSFVEEAEMGDQSPSKLRTESESSSIEEEASMRENTEVIENPKEVVQIDDSEDEGSLHSEQSFMIDVGTNVFVPDGVSFKGRRPIIIDGSNVAFGHGLSTRGLRVFSSRGVEICASFFTKRGHKVIVFVPLFRRWCPKTLKPEILQKMSDKGLITYTPSRKVRQKLTVPYDDRYIVQCAVALGGVIVSTDNYKDLLRENPTWKNTIEKRLLMFTFVGDMLMFPQDPLGRHGPKLDEFLLFPR